MTPPGVPVPALYRDLETEVLYHSQRPQETPVACWAYSPAYHTIILGRHDPNAFYGCWAYFYWKLNGHTPWERKVETARMLADLLQAGGIEIAEDFCETSQSGS